MAKPNINIQDGYLFQNLKANTPMLVGLITGSTLTGTVKRFDRFAIVLEEDEHEVLVYKHAIATIEESR